MDVHFEAEVVVGVSVRCDARNPSYWFLETVCAHARGMDCALFSPEQHLLMEAQPSTLWRALETSCATAYVRDPHGFINAVAEKKGTLQ